MSQSIERNATSALQRATWAPIDRRSTSTEGSRSQTPSAIYRELRLMGFVPDQAGNLTAYLSGIRPVEGGWTPREIERLLFVRHVVRRGWDAAPVAS